MAITAKCPNGHVLKVKDEFAGKSGLCPHCHSRILVPMPVHPIETEGISDDEVLGLLGPPGGHEDQISSFSANQLRSARLFHLEKSEGLPAMWPSGLDRLCELSASCGTPLPNLESAKT